MSDVEQRLLALEQEVASLRAIQDIQQLRFEYWYSLVDKDVARLMACFTDDVFLEYGFGIEMRGQEPVAEFFTGLLGSEDLIRQVPRGSNPQISVTSDTEAEGRWLVEVTALRESQEDGRRVSVQYYEKYRRTDTGWKLYHMRNDYLGFESFTRREGP